jgi:hypothetical protein
VGAFCASAESNQTWPPLHLSDGDHESGQTFQTRKPNS